MVRGEIDEEIAYIQARSSMARVMEVVEGLYPTPHIHEQMTACIMATSTTTLSTTR